MMDMEEIWRRCFSLAYNVIKVEEEADEHASMSSSSVLIFLRQTISCYFLVGFRVVYFFEGGESECPRQRPGSSLNIARDSTPVALTQI